MPEMIRVMVIDDSIVYRSWLIRSLSEDPRFEVVGFAGNAYEANQKIPRLKPDILTLDIEMPGMSGIDFLKKLLPSHPVPVILVSSLNLRVFDALEAGAVDFVRKPDDQNGLSKTSEIAEYIELSPARTRALLSDMTDVVVEGANKNRKYRLATED